MNVAMLHALADARAGEIRRAAERRHLETLAISRPRPARSAGFQARGRRPRDRARMQARVGFTLVEAGLRLVAKNGPRD
jgi:hypothetical protein